MAFELSEPQAIVYQATNSVNGKRYIGFTTKGLEVRRSQHLKNARAKIGRCPLFHAAIRKHGPDNFVFEVLGDFDGDEDLAKLYEIEAIAKYKPEYNLSHGGDGGSMPAEVRAKIRAGHLGRKSPLRGKALSAEHRANISLATIGVPKPNLRGKPISQERRDKLRAVNMGHLAWNKGKPMREETKEKLRVANKGQVPWSKGKKYTEEAKRNMSAAQKLKHQNRSEAYTETLRGMAAAMSEKNKIPVICVTDGRVFASSVAAAAFYGFGKTSVSQVVRGIRKHTHGLVFKRYEAPE